MRSEVIEILRMWSVIEGSYDRLSEDERKQVEKEAAPLGEAVRFLGFSANEEFKHFSAADDLIEEGRFGRFYGRDLDSHAPLLDSYRRMLAEFAHLSPAKRSGDLSVADLIDLLRAMVDPENRNQ